MKNIQLFFTTTRIMGFISMSLLFCSKVNAQTIDYLKEGISPQVALMNRYGDYPVDLSTGLVDITIPLYEIQTASLTIPLTLKFHPSGLRSDEREGILGIRWAFSGLGHVSRTIKGYPDDYGYPFNTKVTDPGYTPDFYDLYGTTSTLYKSSGADYNSYFTSGWYNQSGQFITGGKYLDTEYDIYSYSLPSEKNGKFIAPGSMGLPMPYDALKIYSPVKNGDVCTIIDEDGTTYRFGETRANSVNKTIKHSDKNDDNRTTTWYLSTIISANKQDSILIDYVRPDKNEPSGYNETMVLNHNLHANSRFETKEISSIYAGLYTYYSPLFLLTEHDLYRSNNFKQNKNDIVVNRWKAPLKVSSIQIKSSGKSIGSINFIYDNTSKFLREILVYNSLNEIVKTIRFVVGNDDGGVLNFLQQISFSDERKYLFDYYGSSHSTPCGELEKNSDWWGFYASYGGWFKGMRDLSVQNFDEFGNSHNKTVDIAGGDKATNTSSMETGMLKSIDYPTGGKTTFEYEANSLGYNKYGGLRINRIINIADKSNPQPEIKSYVYGSASLPSYLYPANNNYNNYYMESMMDCYISMDEFYGGGEVNVTGSEGYGRYVRKTFLNTVPAQYTEFRGNTLRYKEVTEIVEETASRDQLKTVYEYDIKELEFSYFNAIRDDEFQGYLTGYRHGYVSPADFWHGNKLKKKTIFKNSEKVKEYEYTYQKYTKENVYDLPVFRYIHHNVVNSSSWSSVIPERKELEMIYPDFVRFVFGFKHQEYTIGADRLVQEIERTYDENGQLMTQKKMFDYDPVYLMPIKESVIQSDGNKYSVSYKYPFDHKTSNNYLLYEEMTNRNILSPIIEKKISYGNNPEKIISTTVTDYLEIVDNKKRGYYPKTILYLKGNSSLFYTQVDYSSYSSEGRLTGITKNSLEKTVYLWSYSHQYPVAIIQGATYNEVATILGSTFIKNLSGAVSPTKSDIERLDNLRISLPEALITTCTYKPLVGKLTETDPSGFTIYYEYKPFSNLLQEVYIMNNGKKEILEAYEYNYANR